VHQLFIMLRVMRLSADNPLLWQSALTGMTAATICCTLLC
jgi:hypothetical protein